MNVAEFTAKWKRADLKERSAAQEHFIDLCRLLAHPTPAEADPTGDTFCFERGASKQDGGEGFADVWKKDFFGWEYKGRHKDLDAAYNQLLQYRDALDNPPLLVVCDFARIVIHTNFTRTKSVAHEITLEQMSEPRNLELLRALFHAPERLRPGTTSEMITQEVAEQFAGIALSMRQRGLDPRAVAHFLDRVIFCLFAEDIQLLPDMIFTRIVEKSGGDPVRFSRLLAQLFRAMADGGEFGLENIRHFNGNLFDDDAVLDVTAGEMKQIAEAARMDWSAVDPSIFGTLFERGLDPAKRTQLGAHFTGREDIDLLVEAVVLQPLRREWAETRRIVDALVATGRKQPGATPAKPLTGAALRKARAEASSIIHGFLARLQSIKVLDPACGSGNFLYVTLQKLKDLEKTVIVHAMEQQLGAFLPAVGPWQLYGIEINAYAHDLAQMTVWIGWLQWIRFNGFGSPQDPILRPMKNNFQCRDAILDLTDPARPQEPEWPRVDFIVGNPPFLGDKIMRRGLGDAYVDQLRTLYDDRLPGQSDLCCYWFEKARAHIEQGKCQRAGLLATQGIRGGANREVLKRIKETGDIFWAIPDKDWILDGANVHVSLIAFDDKSEVTRTLDGAAVAVINSNLTHAADTVTATPLIANQSLSFIGASVHGPFALDEAEARRMLVDPNAKGWPNSDVVRPWANALTITNRDSTLWIVDVPPEIKVEQAAFYESPFRHLQNEVYPVRQKNRRPMRARNWWILGDPQKAMRRALSHLERFIISPRVAKHRLFVWAVPPLLATDAVVAFARSDDYFFGVLHSRLHEVWALKLGTRLETRPRYTPSTCFEPFPIPEPTPEQEQAIAAAAKELNELRERWLNPPEWTREEILEFPGTPGGPWSRYIAPGTNVVRYPRLVPKDEACAKLLQKRTLTKLYNERPAWLDLAHRKLDAAVFAAYGWDSTLPDDALLAHLLELNLSRAKA